MGYTAGVYGRNEDVFCINGQIITTGYRATGQRLNVKPGTIEKYEKKAEKIATNWDLKREQRRDKILKLWGKLLAEAED